MTIETRAVSADEADIRLDRWLRRHFPAVTQGVVEKLCRTGQVRVGGKRVAASTRLQPGDAVRIPPLPRPSQIRGRLTRTRRGTCNGWSSTATTR
jgi:23S rRNA pseudouridine955/2504/2580 synthase